MVKLAFTLFLVLALMLTGCSSITPPATSQPTLLVSPSPQLPSVMPATLTPVQPKLSIELLKNSTFFAPHFQKTVTLVNGQYTSGSYQASLLPQYSTEEVNGAEISKAAVLLAESNADGNTHVSLIVFLNQASSVVQAGSAELDDINPVIQSVLELQNGKILVTALFHRPNDGQASPTQPVTLTYAFTQGKLWLCRMTVPLEAGKERAINIESPAFGSAVSQSVEIKGSMPLSPFEATLGYSITDTSGAKLDSGSFMVSAVDAGAPATFDHTFDLTGIPAGAVIRIFLFEGDMSGFRDYLVMDSLELTVK